MITRSMPMRRTRIRRISQKRAGIPRAQQDEMDEVCRWIVMVRAGAFNIVGTRTWMGTCEYCKNRTTPGQLRALQWAHLAAGRANRALRWRPEAHAAVCGGCHQRLDQSDTVPSKDDWLRERVGEAVYEDFQRFKGKREPGSGPKPKVDFGTHFAWLKMEKARLGG